MKKWKHRNKGGTWWLNSMKGRKLNFKARKDFDTATNSHHSSHGQH